MFILRYAVCCVAALVCAGCGSYARDVQTISFTNGCKIEVGYAGTEHLVSPSTTAGFAAITTPKDIDGRPCQNSMVALGQAAETGIGKPLIAAATTAATALIIADAYKEGMGNIKPDSMSVSADAEGGAGGAGGSSNATAGAHAGAKSSASSTAAVFKRQTWK